MKIFYLKNKNQAVVEIHQNNNHENEAICITTIIACCVTHLYVLIVTQPKVLRLKFVDQNSKC